MADHPEEKKEGLEEKVKHALTTDDHANPNESHAEEKKKPMTTLESVFDELSDLVNLGIGFGVPAAGYALTGNPGVLATSAAFTAATPGTKTSKVIRNESLSGALFGTFAHYTLLPLEKLGSLAKAAYMSAWAVPAQPVYITGDHLSKNYSLTGLYKNLKENSWKYAKNAFKKGIVPLNIASAILLPSAYMVGAIAFASFLYRKLVAGGKGEETDKNSYLKSALNLTNRTTPSTVNGIYDLGTSFRNWFDYWLKSSAKPEAKKPEGGAAPAH